MHTVFSTGTTEHRRSPASATPLVLKFGGELVEDPAHLNTIVAAIATIVASGAPLVVVHGGGREIDAALKVAGIEKRQVEGLRVTDERTLDVVVAVLGGAVNTRLVAALATAGVAAVGLTGADGRCGLSVVAPPHRTVDGQAVDLGRVGLPTGAADVRLLDTLVRGGFVPVVSSIGIDESGGLLNVNADTFAGHLAARVSARRLVIAGATAGVLDGAGATIPEIDAAGIARLISDRTATAGMVAKLRSCEQALAAGVGDVVVVDGRDRSALEDAVLGAAGLRATHMVLARGESARVSPATGGGMNMMATTAEETQAREARHILQTYRRMPVTFVRGQGVRLYDTEGRSYLDLLSGIGVASLGHAHPGLARALAEQAETLLHTSNLFYHPLQGQVAERLSRLSGLERVFFCNSGTEAVEACLKFARRYWHTRGEPRAEFIALEGSFHGRTMGALSVTSDVHYRAPFEPLVPGVRFVPANDPTALLAAVSSATAAIIAEPIQGEGGVRPLTPAFAAAINEACRKTGALLIADEVQCGLGRTGRPFYFSELGLQPHLVSLGKALGGGVAVGAALVSQQVANEISFGDHGSTYGGNLLACRAALCFLNELVDGGLIAHVGRIGAHVAGRLRAIAANHAFVREIRGEGLMWGLQLSRDAAPVVPAGLARGVIVNRTSETVVRLLPPLVITEAEIDEGLARLDAALTDLGAGA